MRVHSIGLFLLPLLATVACKGDKDSAKTNAGSSSGGVGEKGKTVETKGSDALWAMAPEGTFFGAVLSPGTGASLHSMVGEILTMTKAMPIGQKFASTLETKLVEGLGINVLDAEAVKKAGLDLQLGAAVFMQGKNQGTAILPVSDPDAFRTLAKGKAESADGLSFDRYTEHFICMPKEKLYLCAESTASLKNFGSIVNGTMAKQVAALPPQYRGHIEAVLDVPKIAAMEDDSAALTSGEFAELFAEPGLGIAAFRLSRGALTGRLWFQAKPVGVLSGSSDVGTTLSKDAVKQNPAGLVSMRIPPSAWKRQLSEMPDKKFAGLSLRDDVFGKFSGEVSLSSSSGDSLWGKMSIGILEAAPFKTLLNMGCGMAPMAGVPGIEITPGDGVCSAMVDVSKLPLPAPEIATLFKAPVPIKAEVLKDRFSLTIGEVSEASSAGYTSAGLSLLSEEWNMAVWVQKTSVAMAFLEIWPEIAKTAPPEGMDAIKMAVWVASHVNEMGFAGAVRNDGVHALFHIGTFAEDSDEAYAAYQKAVRASIETQTDTFSALAKDHPGSLAADMSAGGSMAMAGVVGLVAAVMIPSFVKYAERSKGGANVNTAVQQFASVADKVCECKTVKCAQEEMGKAGRIAEPSHSPSESEMKQIAESSARMSECVGALVTP